MSADEFNMDPHYSSYYKETQWTISMRDGETRTSFEVYDEDVQHCIRDSFEYIDDTVKAVLKDRVEEVWDKDLVTDEERRIFEKVLEMII